MRYSSFVRRVPRASTPGEPPGKSSRSRNACASGRARTSEERALDEQDDADQQDGQRGAAEQRQRGGDHEALADLDARVEAEQGEDQAVSRQVREGQVDGDAAQIGNRR